MHARGGAGHGGWDDVSPERARHVTPEAPRAPAAWISHEFPSRSSTRPTNNNNNKHVRHGEDDDDDDDK